MKDNLKYIIAGIIITGSLAFLLSGTGEEQEATSGSSGEDKALSALLGGDTAKPPSGGKSVFDSDFFKKHSYGRSGEEETTESSDDNDILDPVSEGNPINPATGTPYTDSVMKQFEELSKKFPGNSVIPRRMRPEELAAIEADKQKAAMLASAVNTGTASRADIEFYYNHLSKPVRDRLELLDYIIDKSGMTMSEDIKKRYEEVRAMNRTQLESYEKARKEALQKAK